LKGIAAREQQVCALARVRPCPSSLSPNARAFLCNLRICQFLTGAASIRHSLTRRPTGFYYWYAANPDYRLPINRSQRLLFDSQALPEQDYSSKTPKCLRINL